MITGQLLAPAQESLGLLLCPACGKGALVITDEPEFTCDRGCRPDRVPLAALDVLYRLPASASRESMIERVTVADRAAKQELGRVAKQELGHTPTLNAGSRDSTWETPIPFGGNDLPSFPVDALPRSLRDFVTAVAEDTQTPPDMASLLVLVAVATCIQRRAVVQVTPSYAEPLSLFAMVVAPSGERKSAVVGHVAAPVYAWEREVACGLATSIEAARFDRRLLDQKLIASEKRAASAKPGDETSTTDEARAIATEISRMPPTPEYPRRLTDDITPEALAKLMAQQGECMGVLGAEGGVFETMVGRYSNGVANLDIFLKGHAGDPVRVHRGSAPSIIMDRPALSIGLAVQPDVIRGLGKKDGFRGRGLIARFVYGLPVSLVGSRRVKSTPVPERISRAYADTIKQLLKGEGDRVRDILEQKEIRGPEKLTLSEMAEGARLAFAGLIERRLGPGKDLHHVADWGNKLTGAGVRIAGLLHSVICAEAGRPVAGAIAGENMSAALRIAEYLLPHALAAIGEMGADPELDAARTAWDRIDGLGWKTFSVRDLHRLLRGQARFSKVDAVKGAIKNLDALGRVREMATQVKPGPGKPASPVWEVNPCPPDNMDNMDLIPLPIRTLSILSILSMPPGFQPSMAPRAQLTATWPLTSTRKRRSDCGRSPAGRGRRRDGLRGGRPAAGCERRDRGSARTPGADDSAGRPGHRRSATGQRP